jgi:archaellum biogenesis protein FlaJ (TadC family)
VNAVVAVERPMIAEERMERLESDVAELKTDVKALSARVDESPVSNAREFGSLKAQMEKGFGELRAELQKELGALRADSEKQFGELRTSIESAKLWMLVTGVGSVILITFFTFVGRALRLLP